jgi:hypothetical protein
MGRRSTGREDVEASAIPPLYEPAGGRCRRYLFFSTTETGQDEARRGISNGHQAQAQEENTNMRLSKGALLASAVAAMVLAVGCSEEESQDSSPTNQSSQTVKCYGVNSCKGTAECAGVGPDSKKHACQGQNGCKGQGWISIPSEKECTDKGGSIITG